MSRPIRILLLVLVIAAVVVLLFTWIFPWVERQLEQDPTIGALPASPVDVAAERA